MSRVRALICAAALLLVTLVLAPAPSADALSTTATQTVNISIVDALWENGNNVHVLSSGQPLRYLILNTPGAITLVEANGIEVLPGSYTTEEGPASDSLILILSSEFLETLALGEHTLSVKFDNGSVFTDQLFIEAAPVVPPDPELPEVPSTGLFSRWISGLGDVGIATTSGAVVAALGIIGFVIFTRKCYPARYTRQRAVLASVFVVGLSIVIMTPLVGSTHAEEGDPTLTLAPDTLNYTLFPGESSELDFSATVTTNPSSLMYELLLISDQIDTDITATISGGNLSGSTTLPDFSAGDEPIVIRTLEANAASGDISDYTLSIAISPAIPVGDYSFTITYFVETEEPVPPSRPLERCQATGTSNIKVNLNDNLIPIRYDGSIPAWVKADVTNTSEQYSWYNYDTQMWANAATVQATGTNTRQYYLDAAPGTIIPEADILTYMVYVPRFDYTIYKGATGTNLFGGGTAIQPGCIDIFFTKATDPIETGTAGYIDEYGISGWRTHPAFTFGGKELDGFWTSKFSPSPDPASTCYSTPSAANCNNATSSPRVKPNTRMHTWLNVNNSFFTVQNMSLAGNIYGYTTDTDVHMMKNSEWGAMAYLSQSVYGKYGNSMYTGVNKEVYINKSATPVISGLSNGTPSQVTTNTQCPYDTIVDRGAGTGACGAGASTTGNIYGIYDTSGGAWAYVMGNYNATSSTNGMPAIWFANPTNAKYFDKYTTTSVLTACDGGICYGHSLSETQQWYTDRDYNITATAVWYMRGGYNTYELSGIFAYSSSSVVIDAVHTYRVVHP